MQSNGTETGRDNGTLTELERQIGDVANAAAPTLEPAPARSTQLCCQACLVGSTYDPATPMPDKCACGGRLWLGDTPEQAFNRAKMAASVAAPKPKQKRASAPKAAVVEPTPSTEPTPGLAVTADGSPKERQQAAQAALIKAHGLNHTEFVEVGTGVVDAVGYTIWTDSRPEYVVQSPIETAMDFMRQYREDRKTHPAIRFDAAQIQDLSEELRPCVFRGQLMASLVYPGGILRVKSGQTVKIGAKVSGTGSVVWCVLP